MRRLTPLWVPLPLVRRLTPLWVPLPLVRRLTPLWVPKLPARLPILLQVPPPLVHRPASAAPGATGSFPGMQVQQSVTYDTVQDYTDSLNEDGTWATYDAANNTAKITSLGDFDTQCKAASKDVGAFDDLNRSQAENDLFGTGQTGKLHFAPHDGRAAVDQSGHLRRAEELGFLLRKRLQRRLEQP